MLECTSVSSLIPHALKYLLLSPYDWTQVRGPYITGTPILTVSYLLLLGESMTLQAISPSVIVLRPPEKLVLEVMGTGRYLAIQWARNGEIRGVPGSAFSPPQQSFTHFGEVYFVEETSVNDVGRYELVLYRSTVSTRVRFDVLLQGTTK
jgi:hypothetical protein